MPTQIAATPLLTGEDAKRLLKELEREPSEKAKLGAQIIREMFEPKDGKD